MSEIKYREPTEEQLKLMREFSDICGKAMELILKCESNPALQNASTRIQEGMMWFHAYIINDGKIMEDKSIN